MIIVKSGVTRIVFLIGNMAIKIPNVRTWKQFLLGILANMQERNFSKMNHKLLAKVKFSDLLGFVLIMERTDEITISQNLLRYIIESDYKNDELYSFIISDFKRCNFGYRKGTKIIVKIDYGN